MAKFSQCWVFFWEERRKEGANSGGSTAPWMWQPRERGAAGVLTTSLGYAAPILAMAGHSDLLHRSEEPQQGLSLGQGEINPCGKLPCL